MMLRSRSSPILVSLITFLISFESNESCFADDNADADDGIDPDDIAEPETAVDSDRLGNLLNQGDDDEYMGAEEYF